MKRAALYVRVSSEEQKKYGLSIANQIEALRKYCLEHSFEEVGLYNDAGISARKSYKKKPAMSQLLEDCKLGKFDIILFTRLDRWFRSVPDYYEIQKILDDSRVTWRAIWEDLETVTADGIFKTNIVLSFSQAESDRTRERIASVIKYRYDSGDYVGKVPFGYKRIDKKLVIDEDTAPIVREMFRIYLDTFSSGKVRKYLIDSGNRCSENTVLRRLKSPIYAGMMVNGPCPAYITPDQHELIKKMMLRKAPKNTARKYIFSRLCVCGECGKMLSGQTSHIQTALRKITYINMYCTNYEAHDHALSIREDRLEQYVLDHFREAVQGYNVAIKAKSKGKSADEQIKKLRAKLERIGMRFELGDIDIDEYKEKREAVIAEINTLRFLPKEPQEIDVPDDWEDIYKDLDDAHKNTLWCSFIDKIIIRRDVEPEIVIKDRY